MVVGSGHCDSRADPPITDQRLPLRSRRGLLVRVVAIRQHDNAAEKQEERDGADDEPEIRRAHIGAVGDVTV